MSIAYEAYNDIKNAIASAEEAFVLNDKNVIYCENLAKLRTRQELSKAIELIEMALDYGENNAGILITYAGIPAEDEQYEKAEIVLRKDLLFLVYRSDRKSLETY